MTRRHDLEERKRLLLAEFCNDRRQLSVLEVEYIDGRVNWLYARKAREVPAITIVFESTVTDG
jgi:hypothetical protein